jgi:hypothetical protein
MEENSFLGSLMGGSTSGKGGMFGGANFGTTMQGIGSLVGGIGSWFALKDQAKYQDKLFDREENRIEKENKRQDKFDNGMSTSFS